MSFQSFEEFCGQEGVSNPSFYRWRKRLDQTQPGLQHARRSGDRPSKTATSPFFVPVKVASSDSPSSLAVGSALAEVEFPNGVRIRIPATHVDALRVAIVTGTQACREVG
jgi:hypothetical protein